jgi:hypothetical protein
LTEIMAKVDRRSEFRLFPVGIVAAERKLTSKTLDFVGRVEAVNRVEIIARDRFAAAPQGAERVANAAAPHALDRAPTRWCRIRHRTRACAAKGREPHNGLAANRLTQALRLHHARETIEGGASRLVGRASRLP